MNGHAVSYNSEEMARKLELPAYVLRLWETYFEQLGFFEVLEADRCYHDGDVVFLKGIKHLLYGEGYTVREVQDILGERGANYVMMLGRDADLCIDETESAYGELMDMFSHSEMEFSGEFEGLDKDEGKVELHECIPTSNLSDSGKIVSGDVELSYGIMNGVDGDCSSSKLSDSISDAAGTKVLECDDQCITDDCEMVSKLSSSEVKLLQSIMVELLKSKRMLDQAY